MQWLQIWLLAVLGATPLAIADPGYHSEFPDSGDSIVRPRAPQSLGAPTPLSPLSVTEFLTVVGGTPTAKVDTATPPSDASLDQWRKEQQRQLNRIGTLINSHGKRLGPGIKAALVALKGGLENWQRRDRNKAMGNQVFSPPALKAAGETAESLVAYAETLAALPLDPARSQIEQQRQAFETMPWPELSRPTASVLRQLAPHHQSQLKTLLTLRDSLVNASKMEEFAASLRDNSSPSRRIDDPPQR